MTGQSGKSVYLQAVLLTQQPQVGPTHLLASWDDEDACARSRVTLRWTRQRSWIEGLFRDDKSGGFQLDKTRLEPADRLAHLLLVMAIALFWFVAIGRRLVTMGLRSEVESAATRSHTYFQIGWRWLKKQFQFHRPLPFSLYVYT